MKRHWVGRLFAVALLIVIFVAGFGSAVWQLWNWLMPAIFGLGVITFGQAVGLLALAWLLFGSWRGFAGHGGHWKHRMRERWERMTPEQREQFRAAMERRCGPRRGEAGAS
jgi:hypothetical protein